MTALAPDHRDLAVPAATDTD
ncbi:hypothetical protein ACNFR7_09875 [Streptomyces sp. RM1]